jgi:hypothetical protein
MPVLYGTVMNGKIELPHPADLPDGTPVRIEAGTPESWAVGISEEDWPTTPEGIAAHLARIDALEPVLTPEEDAAWREARAQQKAWEFANREKYHAKIDGLFQ